MYAGIEATLQRNTSYICALALSVYTEILGGLVTGNLKKENNSKGNYIAFLEYLGEPYVELHKQVNLYKRIRSGLVHEFAPKKQYIIWLSETVQDRPGLDCPGNVVNFHLREYYRDFRNGVEKYYRKLKDGQHADLIHNFLNVTKLEI